MKITLATASQTFEIEDIVMFEEEDLYELTQPQELADMPLLPALL